MTQQPWGQQPMQRPAGQPAWGQPQQPWGQAQPVAGQQQQAWGRTQPAWGQPVAQQRPPQGYAQQYPSPPQAPYQGGPGGYPPPQPPRSGSPVKLVVLGLVAAIAIGFFAFSLTNFLNTDEQAGPETLPTPEIGETSAPPTGIPEPEFNPPDIPSPKDGPEAEQWLVNNALYAQTVQVPTNCTLGRVDIETISPEALQEHLNTLTGCLMMVWQEPMQRAGFIMPRPPITVYSEPIVTACGTMETRNAFYCSGDQRLYYATNVQDLARRNDPQVIDNAFFPDNVMGHEFGHAIQGRTGIWAAYAGFRGGNANNKEFGLELSRRVEVQADCLAGMFLNAVAQASRMTEAERAGIPEIAHAIGDDRLSGNPDALGDHGLGVSRQAWSEAGLSTDQAAVCNTWTVPADRVR